MGAKCYLLTIQFANAITIYFLKRRVVAQKAEFSTESRSYITVFLFVFVFFTLLEDICTLTRGTMAFKCMDFNGYYKLYKLNSKKEIVTKWFLNKLSQNHKRKGYKFFSTDDNFHPNNYSSTLKSN